MLGAPRIPLHHGTSSKQFMASVLLLAGVIVAAFLWTILSKDSDVPEPVGTSEAIAAEPAK